MSQKIKAPQQDSSKGFIWGIVAILIIAAVVGGLFIKKNSDHNAAGMDMPQQDVAFDVSFKDNAVVLASKDLNPDAKTAVIYEDFSCPHCGELAESDHENLLAALNNGDIKVEYRILNFLDDPERRSSSRAGAAVIDLAKEGNAKGFWNLQQYIFANQVEVSRTWGNEEMARAVSSYGVDQSIVDGVKSGKNQEATQSVFQANSDKLSKQAGQVSTPRIFVDDKEIELVADKNTGSIKSWVPEVVNP
ncbi:thioredoxin domain-containing protein [Corynebacterium sp. 320]|uniref:Thioredoxin domain-containing protein n=1 Tax=Corynebacterium zhongnanshanii TaxID=2768834 RepID=A0ABQ6VDM0_9CORY|nr:MULTISPECIES: thioredoxin domain-containing protein [Corynebacterium]KAB1501416.1 thioredoxin domain-containing protein [Corynebacterium sp. 320]KAB1551459.1 thioredoxin domain-containing protein [Corynebacterium sp. 321]KAB1551713.1 thioredoxin domain-containing protein [Corynebacterium sp. 319]KAB3521002.1 thioredoxin domain-containing protein [Corynebacterium zhongnanshanii]KAB3525774.1 thioredoxin domain-containing protein [Corynebacterium sp. 250]